MKIAGVAVLVCLMACVVVCSGAGAQSKVVTRAAAQRPPGATHCDILLPVHIELVPTNSPEIGRTANFQVRVESKIDPDIVKSTWIEYELPAGARRSGTPVGPGLLGRSGRSVLELSVTPPDHAPSAVRARVVIQFMDGSTVSQTATRWINLREDDVPEGMARRVPGPDGTAIRIYQGTVRQ
jgi:hypothetical protein